MSDRRANDMASAWHALPLDPVLRHFGLDAQQGRVVHADLKRVIPYLFATSMAEVLVLMLALVSGIPAAAGRSADLWINIVTEGTVTVYRVIHAPPMNTLFHTVALPLASPLPLLALASVVLWAEEARKPWVRTRGRTRP